MTDRQICLELVDRVGGDHGRSSRCGVLDGLPTVGPRGRARTWWRWCAGRRASSASSSRTARGSPSTPHVRSHSAQRLVARRCGHDHGAEHGTTGGIHDDRYAERAVGVDGMIVVDVHVVVGRRDRRGRRPTRSAARRSSSSRSRATSRVVEAATIDVQCLATRLVPSIAQHPCRCAAARRATRIGVQP